MEASVKLYSFTFRETRTYLLALLFIVGNIVFPQLCHLVQGGGLMWLPIYFFTLVAAYKYGVWVGLLTAILSPLANSVLFGMPGIEFLPAILTKSVLLAGAAAYFAHRFGKISILAILLAVLTYQCAGVFFEWLIVGDFMVAIQDFRLGLPGMLVQVVGGYALLRAIAKI